MAITNVDAEKAILGATINSQGRSTAILGLEGSDFTDPRNRLIASVLRDMMRRDMAIESRTVVSELKARGKLDTPGGAGGPLYVMALGGLPANAEYHADEVRSATRVRKLYYAARTTSERCETEEAEDRIDELLLEHRRTLDAIPGPAGDPENDEGDTLGVILSEQDRETDWLIPGWMAREERAVIVAGEGVAKTTLLRQFAICMAAGLNPWTKQRVADGMRVLFVDAENSRDQSRRSYRWIANRCYSPLMDHGWQSRIIHKTRNDGVNLIGRDEQWFREIAERISPDVIILSPAYKLMRGDPKEDGDVLALLDVIDRVRVQHKAAVIIETHAPHGQFASRDMRPFGSSVWLRWPEIGIGFQRDTETPKYRKGTPNQFLESVDWRGAREPRDWPDLITHGDKDLRQLPWVPTREDWAPSVDVNYEIDDVA